MKKLYFILILLCCHPLIYAQSIALQWAKQFSGTAQQFGNVVAVDQAGNVYTAGYFHNTVDFDPGPGVFNLTGTNTNSIGINFFGSIFLSKLNAQGEFVWAKKLTNGADEPYAMTFDNNGNIYVTGYFNGTSDFDPGTGVFNLTSNSYSSDIFISKIDPSGNFVWAKAIGGSLSDRAFSLEVDNNNNIYVCGEFSGSVDFDPGIGNVTLSSAGDEDGFILKLDASGNFEWVKIIGASSADIAHDLDIDNAGNVCIAGIFNGTVDFDPGSGIFNATAVGISNTYILKLTPSGNFVWAKIIESSVSMGTSTIEHFISINIDPSDNILLASKFKGTVDFDPGLGVMPLTFQTNMSMAQFLMIYILKLNENGDFVWVWSPESLYLGANATPKEILTDTIGNVYAFGDYTGAIDFDAGPNVDSLTSISGAATYLLKLDTVGNTVWAKSINNYGTSFPSPNSLAINTSSNLYITGGFTYYIDVDPSSGFLFLASSDIHDVYVAAYEQCSSSVSASMPSVSASSNLVCSGAQLQLSVDSGLLNNASHWVWYADSCGGIAIDTGNTITVQPNQTTTYYARGEGNCTEPGLCDSITIYTLPVQAVSATTVTACGGASITLNGSPSGGTFSIPNPYTGPSTTFTYTYIDTNGCSIISNPAQINRYPLPNISFSVSPNDTICSGTSITLSGSGASAYSWQSSMASNPLNGVAFVPSSTSSYTVIGVDANGCSQTSSALIHVISNPPVATISGINSDLNSVWLGNNVTLQVNGGNLNSATNWHWYSGSCGGTFLGTGNSIQVTPTATTTYFVRGEGGCSLPGNCASKTIQANALLEPLIAHYTCDVTPNDEVNGFNGGLFGGVVTCPDRFGNPNSAFLFDGINDFMQINHDAAFNLSNFTISMWFRIDGAGTPGKPVWSMISKNNTDTAAKDPFNLWIDSTYKLGGRIGDGNTSEQFVLNQTNYITTNVNDGQWHQVTLVYDTASSYLNLICYIDGIKVFFSAGLTLFKNSSNIQIGRSEGINSYFKGAIDEVKIYNKALTYDDVQLDYSGNNLGTGPLNHLEWVRGIDAENTASTVDAAGNMYIVGRFTGTMDFDPGPGVVNFSTPPPFWSYGGSGFPSGWNKYYYSYLLKLNANGQFVWAKKICSGIISNATEIKLDSIGNIYITGKFQGSSDFDPSNTGIFNLVPTGTASIYLSKLNNNGDFVWVNQLNLPGGEAGTLEIDNLGNVYLTGDAKAPSTTWARLMINKFSASGTLLWSRFANQPPSVLSKTIIEGTALDGVGNLVIAGTFEGLLSMTFPSGSPIFSISFTATGTHDAFVAKIDGAGNLLWFNRYEGPNASANGLAIDASGNICCVGKTKGLTDFDLGLGVVTLPPGAENGFLLKLNPAGNFLSVQNLFRTNISPGLGTFIKDFSMDEAGNFYYKAFLYGVVDVDPGPKVVNIAGNDISLSGAGAKWFMSKLNPSGNFVWAKVFNSFSSFSDGFVHDTSGVLYASGNFEGIVDFEPGTPNMQLSSVSMKDGYMLKTSPCASQVPPTIPIITASADSICIGDTLTLSLSSAILNDAIAWNWYTSNQADSLIGTGVSITITPSTTTTYFVRGEGPCVVSGALTSKTIIVNALPTVTAVSLNRCSGSPISLIGTPAGGTFSIANPYSGPSTTFTYTYTDILGCVNTSAPATITTRALPVMTVNASPSSTICAGKSITLTATGAVSYVWSNGNISPMNGLSFIPTSASTYTVTGSNSFGCTSSKTIAINFGNDSIPSTLAVIAASRDSIFIGEETMLSVVAGSLNTANAWKWYTESCGGTLVGVGDSISVSPITTTTYFVRGEGTCLNQGPCVSKTIVVDVPPFNSTMTTDGLTQFARPPIGMMNGLTSFTVETWIRTTESKSAGDYWQKPTIIGNARNSSPDGDFGITTNNGMLGMWSGIGVENSMQTNVAINDNQWHHIAAVKNGTSLTLFKDGNAIGSIAVGELDVLNTSDASLAIGGSLHNGNFGVGENIVDVSSFHQGEFAQTRFSNVARYTNNFNPQLNYSPDFNTVALYYYGDCQRAIRIDASGNENRLAGRFAAPTCYDDLPFNNAILYNGVDQSAFLPTGVMNGLTNFTIEGWLKSTDLKTSPSNETWRAPWIFGKEITAFNTGNLIVSTHGGYLDFLEQFIGGSGSSTLCRYFVCDNQWHHIAVSADGTTCRTFIDGIKLLEQPVAGGLSVTATEYFSLMNRTNSNESAHSGLLEEVRFSNVGRYTNDFLPQSTAFGNDINTVALYHSDDCPNNMLVDASLNSNHASLNNFYGGCLGIPAVEPGSGNALSFDGVDDFVDIVHNASLNTTSQLTLEAWIQPTSYSTTFPTIIAKGNAASAYELDIKDDGTIEMEAFIDGIQRTLNGGQINLNEWTHIAATYDGSALKIFQNGIEVGSLAVTGLMGSNSNNLSIGSRNAGFFSGKIDEVRVWNKALAISEIRAGMCRKVRSVDNEYTHLVAYYNCDESTGPNIVDGSLFGNNGIIKNGLLRVTSAAPIGNNSTNNYSGSFSLSLHDTTRGDLVNAYLTSGSAAGMHMYQVIEAPNTREGIIGLDTNNSYFGVFIVSGNNAIYDVNYDYTGVPNIVAEESVRLYGRNDNAEIVWLNKNAILDTAVNLLTLVSSNSRQGEFIVGEFHNAGTIDGDQTNCPGEIPNPLSGTAAFDNQPGVTYQWQLSTQTGIWNDIPGAITMNSYQPTALTLPTYYRRLATLNGSTVVSDEVFINLVGELHPFYTDIDSDGFGAGAPQLICVTNITQAPSGYSLDSTDCDDNNPIVHAMLPFFVDADNDGYGAGSAVYLCAITAPAGYSIDSADCDDNTNLITSGSIDAIEYFIDSDPGTGLGISIPIVSTNPDSLFMSFAINLPTLSEGHHVLTIRARTCNGQWGLFNHQSFYILPNVGPLGTLVAAEYFIDTDPGEGNGIPLTLSVGDTVLQTSNITIPAGLSEGNHLMSIRVKDINNQWSLFENRSFYVTPPLPNPNPIVAAEYFIDTDPGEGNGIPLTLSAGDTVLQISNITIPAGLSEGHHLMSIRVKDINNQWSLFENRTFYVTSPLPNPNPIVAAEYFIDADPGVGNATFVSLTPADTSYESFNVTLPINLTNPNPYIGVRVKDLSGRWSHFEIPNAPLDITVIIQGYYLVGGTMTPALANQGEPNPLDEVDTINVELHSATAPYSMVYASSGILETNGRLLVNFPYQVFGNSYYIVLKHPNMLQTWSSVPLLFTTIQNEYNFTTAASQSYGGTLVEVENGIWANYSGDLNHDENIDLLDSPFLEADIANFVYGYFATDLNGDGNVDLLDAPILEENINNFVFSNHP